MDAAFVLVHSPSVGPATWTPVAERLRDAGATAVVPDLRSVADAPVPFWPRVVEIVRGAVAELPAGGWDVTEIAGEHLHEVVDPEAVTAYLLDLRTKWS